VRALIEMMPQDPGRIEAVAGQVIGDLEAKAETFHGRNGSALTALGKRLREWSENNNEADALGRLRETMDGVCGKLPASVPERETCNAVFAPAKSSAA